MKLWLKKIGWLILIWAGSIAVLALVAGLMRMLMRLIGLA